MGPGPRGTGQIGVGMSPLPLYSKEGRKIKPVTPGHLSLSSPSPPATGDSTGAGQLEPRSPNHSVIGGPNMDREVNF